MRRATWLLLSIALLGLSLGDATAPAGWTMKNPPNLVTPASGKRNHVFYVGEPVAFTLAGKHATRYEVRDYWGEMVDKGDAKGKVSVKVKAPGWYKLTLRGDTSTAPWGDVVGGTTFVIFRKNANFPDLPPVGTRGGVEGTLDQVMRGVIGMGPQRHQANADKPDETIARLEKDLAIDQKMYLPFDPVRKRVLMVAFPNGTKNLAGVRKIVERFKDVVQYWEPRNEPNYGSKGADFVKNELKPFYETIKKVDPKLKILGPGTVSINPHLQPWLEDFFKADGAKYLDAFSFHAYNCVNGEAGLARKSLDSLQSLLKKYGADKLEKWQTEQGYFAALYGSYQPRLQGRWTMVQMMVYEQYGIPKEHNHLWYDVSHGFWDFPTWWENDDGSLNPAAPLMRVWSEELFGKRFEKALDFGELGNKLTVGSLFAGSNGQVAAFQSVGSTDGKVELKVTGGDSLRVVSAFGVVSELPVKDGRAVLPVPELPVYVELAKGQTISVVPLDCGPNLARAAGVTAACSGEARHPADKPDTPKEKRIDNDITKIINGVFENWYWAQKKDDQPWMSNVEKFPAWVEIRLPKPTRLSRVVVYAAPPWQSQGSLLKYELQCEKDGKWVTFDKVDEPAKVFEVFTPYTRTSVDCFYSDRWIFQHTFAPVTTRKVRLLVHEVTWGGGATEAVGRAGGQTGRHQIVLREVELYAK
jgi:F5/8 type C domain